MDSRMQALIRNFEDLDRKFELLEGRVSKLEDKLDVVEEHTCENYNAISELSEWQEKVKDIIEDC